MKKFLALAQALFFYQILFAQQPVIPPDEGQTNLTEIFQNLQIEQDERLAGMVEWHIANNRLKNGIDGFRVEIFFSAGANARESAMKVKRDFLSVYPDIPVHIKFVAPDFKVRVGDFRTRNEALKLKKNIESIYPGSFIVSDIIRFSELASEKK